MKYTIKYQRDELTIVAEVENESERKEAIKGIIYAAKDLYGNNLLSTPVSVQDEPVLNNSEAIKAEEPKEKMATEKQKAFMDKLGINWKEYKTMVEAADLIKSWKIAHGYNVK